MKPPINYTDALNLCREVERYPCLYNINSTDYLRKEALSNAWKEISINMKEDVFECQKRWHNIRGSYSKRINCHFSVNGPNPKKKYYLDHVLQFLKPFIKKKRILERTETDMQNLDNLSENQPESSINNSTEDQDNESSSLIKIETNTDHFEAEENKMESVCIDTKSSPIPFDTEIIPEESTSVPIGISISSKPANISIEPHILTEPTDNQMESSFLCECTRFNPDMHFLRSILPDIQKMNDEQKHRFKISSLQIIGNILYESSQR